MSSPSHNPANLHGASDERLIEICRDVQSDDFEAAFAELYKRYRDRVYAIAYRMTGHSVDAMDVVQECFRALFQKLHSFRADSKFSTWLYRLIVNCSIDHNRRERSRSKRVQTGLDHLQTITENLDSGADDPVLAATDHELGEHVHQALGRLSDKLRSVLVLRYLEGLSYDQLAETLEVQLGTVKSRLARAHVALEQILTGSLGQFDYPVDPGSRGQQRGSQDTHESGGRVAERDSGDRTIDSDRSKAGGER